MSAPTKNAQRTTAIQYKVALLPQQTQHTCWYASARMVLDWCGKLHSVKVADEIKSAVQNDTPMNIDRRAMQLVGTSLGLSDHVLFAWHTSADGLLYLLKHLNSPLWYMGRNHGFNASWGDGHVVVITGFDGKFVYDNDPWVVKQGKRGSMQLNDFCNRLSPPSADRAILHGKK
jgi:hypothetical protein